MPAAYGLTARLNVGAQIEVAKWYRDDEWICVERGGGGLVTFSVSTLCWGTNEARAGKWFSEVKQPAWEFSSVSVGTFHTCGLRTEGLVGWGDNSAVENRKRRMSPHVRCPN